VKGILADNDVGGQVAAIVSILQEPTWGSLWKSLNLSVVNFSDLGLTTDASDLVLWHACQQHEIVLITGNRNQHDPESLEATIARFNAGSHLPVFTLANPKHVLSSKEYAGRVATQLLEHLIDIDNLRGTGRMFLP
jgi:hypothetical protein